jgi:folate-dependent phosphoribosylglycinamide formyltransferase PurN
MYGMYVHQVVENKELETGITVHYVKNTMKGALSLNNVSLTAVDTFATVAERIHELEQAFSQLL